MRVRWRFVGIANPIIKACVMHLMGDNTRIDRRPPAHLNCPHLLQYKRQQVQIPLITLPNVNSRDEQWNGHYPYFLSWRGGRWLDYLGYPAATEPRPQIRDRTWKDGCFSLFVFLGEYECSYCTYYLDAQGCFLNFTWPQQNKHNFSKMKYWIHLQLENVIDWLISKWCINLSINDNDKSMKT